MPRFDEDWIDFMLRPERRGAPPADETLATLGLKTGAVVADVGCGPGFFSLPAARLVAPTGRVYAIDREERMLQLVASRAATEGLATLETRLSPGLPIPLGDAVADLVLCALVLHDLGDRPGLVRELIRIVRPDGRIAVMEWQPEPDDPRPNRLAPEQTTALLTDAGAQIRDLRPLGTRQYLMIAVTSDE